MLNNYMLGDMTPESSSDQDPKLDVTMSLAKVPGSEPGVDGQKTTTPKAGRQKPAEPVLTVSGSQEPGLWGLPFPRSEEITASHTTSPVHSTDSTQGGRP